MFTVFFISLLKFAKKIDNFRAFFDPCHPEETKIDDRQTNVAILK